MKGLFTLIDNLTPTDLIEGVDVLEKHYVKLLLVCTGARRDFLKNHLFPPKYFPNARLVDQTDTISTQDFSKDSSKNQTETNKVVTKEYAQVVLFDGVSFDNDDLLKAYLDHYPAYLLWLGPVNPLLFTYPNKAYFSNSQFSVYARLLELLDYIRYFRPQKEQAL